MHRVAFIGLVCTGLCHVAWADEVLSSSSSVSQTLSVTERIIKKVDLEGLKQLSHLSVNDLKVDAKADQVDAVKDPLQPLNRQIFAINEQLDQYVARPLAKQYSEKVPAQVRQSYRSFRKNLAEPWNAVNQIIQGRPLVATQTLARFGVNTLTSLGFADPAQHFGLTREEESFGMTLGYYGVPSGAYLMLPLMGPSTLRNGLGVVVDNQAQLQQYIFQDGTYLTTQTLNVLDTRVQLFALDDALQGDKYIAMRDMYLQRQQYLLAEKKGNTEQIEFIEDELDDLEDELPSE